MVEIAVVSLGVLLLLTGVVFCLVPVVPGPILSYCAILSLYLLRRSGVPSLTLVIVTGVLTLCVVVLDMVMPSVGAKRFDCSKLGILGSVVGAIVGLFFFPWGLVVGPFLGAFAGELLAGKQIGSSLKGALGAFVGYVAGIMLKIGWCLVLAVCYAFAVLSSGR